MILSSIFFMGPHKMFGKGPQKLRTHAFSPRVNASPLDGCIPPRWIASIEGIGLESYLYVGVSQAM